MAEDVVNNIMRICNMDKNVVSLTLFKQYEIYNWLKEKTGNEIDVLYKEVGFFPDLVSGFPETIFEHFGFQEKDEVILLAINEFNFTAATEKEWDELKRTFLNAMLNKLGIS